MNPLASLKSAGLYLLGLLAAVLSIFGIAYKAGQDSLKAKQAKKTLTDVKKANEIRDKNRTAADDDINKRLRKYSRK